MVQDKIAPADEYSETRLAPIGATVMVVGAEAVVVDVVTTIILDTAETVSIEEIKENFTYDLQSYLGHMALKASSVRYNRIGSLIALQDGVLDYTDCKVNGAETNLTITNEKVAIVGTVIFSVGEN